MWPSCEKCGRLCVRFDDKLCVFHKADRGDYNRSKRDAKLWLQLLNEITKTLRETVLLRNRK